MTIETPTLRHVVYTYEVFAGFEGHEYKIAVLVKKENGRTTYRQILVETSKRKWFGTVQIPERLRRYVEKEVRKKHFQQK